MSTSLIVAIVIIELVLVVRTVEQNRGAGAISPDEHQQLIQSGADLYIIDVRAPGEFASGAMPGAANIPLDRLSGDSLPTDDTSAKRTLERLGFSVVDFGGIGRWRGEPVRP